MPVSERLKLQRYHTIGILSAIEYCQRTYLDEAATDLRNNLLGEFDNGELQELCLAEGIDIDFSMRK
ncbi:hypothetical protein EHO57_13705 [Leptospira langatensis]|uniref:Uncharacterized protein n=1 Tax=Leptospira langatensis TaxID=2484983 RepID=A0A5R2AT17_9LEPT|nr:hypothetical protein [Leptospira langatensis]TGJ99814.1 hypothetical protein EHO57_13705 [Leptospira langatensis]